MDESLIHLEKFVVQQNDYKSICRSHVIEHDNFKFFAIIELRDRRAHQHIDEIIDGINFAFNKIFKTKSLKFENIEELFEKSIKDLNTYIIDLIKLSNIPINLKGLHATIGIFLDNYLFITQRGRLHGFFIFKGKNAEYKIIDILKPGSREPKEDIIFTDIVNGKLDPQQALLLCTESVGSYLTEYNIKKILTHDGITQNTINAHLKEITNNENFAGVMVRNTPINARSSIKIKEHVKKSKTESDTSISRLESTRHTTQELLSPRLIPKIKELIQKYTPQPRERKKKNQKTTAYNRTNEVLDKTTIPSPLKSSLDISKKIFNTSWNFLAKILGILFIFIRQKLAKKSQITTKIQPAEKPTTNITLPKLSLATNGTKTMSIAIVVIIVLIFGSGLFIRNKRIHTQQENDFNAIISQIEDNLLKAEAALIHKAEGRANIHIKEVETLLQQTEQYPKLMASETLNKYQNKIAQINDSIYHIRKIEAPEKLIDLTNELANVTIQGINIFNNTIYLYNDTNPYLAIVNIENQQVTLIDSPETTINVQDLNIFERSNNQPIVLTNNNTLYKLNTSDKELSALDISFDHTDIKDIKTYNTSLYTLNPVQNQIYKYGSITSNSFSRAKQWLTDTDIDISSAVDMYIDGTVYVLFKNGTIQNFLSGKKTSFTTDTTIQPQIQEVTQMSYSTKLKQFYVLEPQQHRIIVFNHEGNFLYQYQFNQTENLQAIGYDDTNTQLLILKDKAIYQIKE